MHVDIGADNEKKLFKDFGEISKHCQARGMPHPTMMYTRGKTIKSERDLVAVKHSARVGR